MVKQSLTGEHAVKKILFLHVPKTGGESILEALSCELETSRWRLEMGATLEECDVLGHPIFPKHASLEEIARSLDLSARTVFLVKRDPFSRLWSGYNHLRRSSWDSRYANRFPDPVQLAVMARYLPFDIWVREILTLDLAPVPDDRRRYFPDITELVLPTTPDFDVEVLDFGELENGFARFLAEAGYTPRPLNRRNASALRPSAAPKWGAELVELVTSVYEKEIQLYWPDGVQGLPDPTG